MTMDFFSLSGKTALVTGGTRGIGQAMAIAMAEAGADIVLIQVIFFGVLHGWRVTDLAQRDTNNQETKSEIEKIGRKAIIYTADLASQASVSPLVSAVLKDGHDIDILLNCAGIQRRYPSHIFPLEDWHEVCDPYAYSQSQR
jgi:2-deoxy-D-gluconate 3-dehydrogenase